MRRIAFALALALTVAPACAAPPAVAAFRPWIDGTDGGEAETQVQALDADTFVIRQSVRTNFEAPFLYLLFGRDRVLLLDTGAGGLRIGPSVDRVIAGWAAAHHRPAPPLVVAHSHAHGDHIAGDDEFRGRAQTTVVGLVPADVAAFFGIRHWPDDLGHIDLGGRRLTVIPTPGHQAAHIMIYDPRLQVMLSGDALYPGRLYVPVNKLADARASIDRIASFARTHPIRAFLGAHIEMTSTPGSDFPKGAATHLSEHVLPLAPATLGELQAGLRAPLDQVGDRQVHDDFIIVPVNPVP